MKNIGKYSQDDIQNIIETEYKLHPRAELVDYYKLLFQAYYGQGHFIHSAATARSYILEELNRNEVNYSPVLQDISAGDGLFRLSLTSLNQDILSMDEFVSMFMAYSSSTVNWQEWSELWNELSILLTTNHPVLNVSHQLMFCRNIIRNKALVSHSDCFKLTYCPHYRVMRINEHDFDMNPKLKEYK